MEFRSPPSATRRNPPRRAKSVAKVSLSTKKCLQSSKKQHHSALNSERSLPILTFDPAQHCSEQEEAEAAANQPLPEESKPKESSETIEVVENNNKINPDSNRSKNPDAKNMEVFLRIRPAKKRSVIGISKGLKQKPKARRQEEPQEGQKLHQRVCLEANDSHSVTLIPPPSMLESKRAKTEVYSGFSRVFQAESSQEDVYESVMHPLLQDFVNGKSCLLVAMGPTSSGKTHTMFGNSMEPGLVPQALKKLLASDKEDDLGISRSYFISMFEIYSERGRGEKIIDLFQGGAELSIHQSNIKELQEVAITSLEEANSLLMKGMDKRTTAATNANSQSSRSQCIINVRSRPTRVYSKRNEGTVDDAVLTIVDLAGAEREKKTGNQGVRFNESNFINNTSMVFGLCLRALLEHQKNPKKALERHYHNSLLTRYLKDYLEARGRMVMVLNVSPDEDNYVDTSFVLRQASPYVNIKFTIPTEEIPNLPRPKRPSTILCKGLLPKRKKFRQSQEFPCNLSKRLSNRQNTVHRTIGGKVNVIDSIDIGKDSNPSHNLSSMNTIDQEEADIHVKDSSSVLLCNKEKFKLNVEDSFGFGMDKNSCASLSSIHLPYQSEEQRHIKQSSSVLIFTEEQFKERISVEVEHALDQENEACNQQDMEGCTDTLRNMLNDHESKVKRMEEHARELELELKKEREHSLELSNEVKMLKDRCAALECENEKLKITQETSKRILESESSESFLRLQDGCFQNDVKSDAVIGGECSSNTSTVVVGLPENIISVTQARKMSSQEEACTHMENNKTGEGNCEMSLLVEKSGCSSSDDLEADQSVNLGGEKRTQSCKDDVFSPGLLECKPDTLLKCEETIPSLILEGCNNHSNLTHSTDADTLLARGEACKYFIAEEQCYLSDEATMVLKEDDDNSLQINEKDYIDNESGCTSLQKLSPDLVGVAKISTSKDQNEIGTCEAHNTLSDMKSLKVLGLSENIASITHACKTATQGEAACTHMENNKTGEGNCQMFLLVDKSGCSSSDDLGAEKSVNLDGQKTTKSCKDDDFSPGHLEYNRNPEILLKCDETIPSLFLEGWNKEPKLTHKGDVNTLLALGEACKSLTAKEQCHLSCEATKVLKEDDDNLLQTNEKDDTDTASGLTRSEKCCPDLVEGAKISTSKNINEIGTSEDQNSLSGAKSNLKKGRMLASLLLNREGDDDTGDIKTNSTETMEVLKGTTKSYTIFEDDVGPIGQCLEELLDLSASEIESGLWKADMACKQKICKLLERHNGILDLQLFKNNLSQQKSLCLRYCFALICKKISNDKQWVSLSQDVNPKSRQKIFRAIVKAQTVGKAAFHAQQGLQQEGLLKNINHFNPTHGRLTDGESSETDCGCIYQTNVSSNALQLDAEYLSEHLKPSTSNRKNLCSSVKSPRRKLLPAPSMLLKGTDDGMLEDEISKVIDKSIPKDSNAQKLVGSRGRVSLAKLLLSR